MAEQGTSREALPGPLEGIKIVEYGVFHAGPGANAILADMGADVVKIETGSGDPERFWVDVGGLSFAVPEGSLTFEASNRNKRDIYLNIETPQGREVFRRLIIGADVFLTNLRISTKRKMELDYEAIRRINPRIIHANVNGYGPRGPMADLGAFDPLGMARSGMLFVTGADMPMMLHMGILDQATAIAASHAILAALVYRERHGKGQEVFVSLFSTGMWLTYFNLLLKTFLNIDRLPPHDRTRHPPLRNVFLCKDGKFIMGTHHPEPKYWPLLCDAVGRPELMEDPRFTTEELRKQNAPALVAIFDEIFATKTRDEWMVLFQERGMMFSPVQTAAEVPDDPQAIANDYIVPFDHPRLGKVKIPGYPAHFSECSAGTRSAAPTIGQHTDEILREIGYDAEAIATLRAEGIVR